MLNEVDRTTSGLCIGAHNSIAGGLHKALEATAPLRMDAVQLFTRNNHQWKLPPITDAMVEAWNDALAARPVRTLVHASYLLNLASPDDDLYRRSREGFLAEAQRCARLGIPHLVFHPGAHLGSGESSGCRRIARALDAVDRELGDLRVRILLENTAGQGTNLGYRFEQLARILEQVERPERFGICIDTCHLFAAGYDIGTPEGYAETWAGFERELDLETVRAFHLNDSKRELGSRVDRHESIGEGRMGTMPFRLLLHDARFRGLPMVLETPKQDDGDRRNLTRLRRLAGGPAPRTAAPVGSG